MQLMCSKPGVKLADGSPFVTAVVPDDFVLSGEMTYEGANWYLAQTLFSIIARGWEAEQLEVVLVSDTEYKLLYASRGEKYDDWDWKVCATLVAVERLERSIVVTDVELSTRSHPTDMKTFFAGGNLVALLGPRLEEMLAIVGARHMRTAERLTAEEDAAWVACDGGPIRAFARDDETDQCVERVVLHGDEQGHDFLQWTVGSRETGLFHALFTCEALNLLL